MKHLQLLFAAFISTSIFFNGCNAQAKPQNSFKLSATILLPGVNGRIDHLSFDNKHQIIFIAALGNNTLEAVDIKNKKVIHTIKNLNEPQGVAFIPESNSLFIANGGTGECDIYNAESFQKTVTVKLSGDADNVRYDAADKKIYVGFGDGGIAIIDPTTFKVITEIKLSGHPESFQIDKTSKKIFVNVPDEEQIDVIDLETNSVINKWKMTEAKANFSMALDAINHRLFIGCRRSPILLIIDTQTGQTISSFSINSDVDDIFYNSVTKEIYLSCGAGYIDVFKQINANSYVANGKVSTHSGARTSLFIPELNQLIVASPSGFNRSASLSIYDIK